MIAAEIKALVDIYDRASAEYRKRHLSDEEKRLLVAAATRGEFHVIVAEQLPGPPVRADGKPMAAEDDPAALAKTYDALRSLCERGLVRYEEGILFRLTGAGFEKARIP